MSDQHRRPDILANPSTGEIAEIERSALVNGGRASILFTLPGGAEGAPPHYHGSYDETFVVVEGVLEVRLGEALAPHLLTAGESIVVRRGEHHAFRNPASDPVRFRTIAAEGAGFERFIRSWYGLGGAGHFARGAPRNPLHLAMALDAGDITLVGPPRALQRLIRRALARLAGATGADKAVTEHWDGLHV